MGRGGCWPGGARRHPTSSRCSIRASWSAWECGAFFRETQVPSEFWTNARNVPGRQTLGTMFRTKISVGVLLLGLGACQVPTFDDTKLGAWRAGLSTASSYTESDLDASGVRSEIEAWSHSYSVELAVSPWEEVPLEPGVRVSFNNQKDKITQGNAFLEDEVTTFDVVGNLRLYGVYTGPVRPWVEAFGGFAYTDVDLQGIGSDDDIGPMFGGGVGLSAFIGQSVSIETAFRYTYWEADYLGLETENDRLAVVIGLNAYF